jgi:ABC-type phosphate/phosphonate transport system substrate-binding protein
MYKIAVSEIVFLMFFVTGCKEPEKIQSEKDSREPMLVIGLVPEQHIFEQLERYKPLASYLSEKIGMKIKLKILSRYGNIVDNFSSLNLKL